MGINLSTIFSSPLAQQGTGLIRILSQGLCIDTLWVACEKVVKKIMTACPDLPQLLQIFWFEFTHQWTLLCSQTGLQVLQTYFSWVLVPFFVAALKKQFVLLMANRNKVDFNEDPHAKAAYELGISATKSWKAWLKGFVCPKAWTGAFYQGINEGRNRGYSRKYDFSLCALVV